MCTFKITNDPKTSKLMRRLSAGGPTQINTVKIDEVYITHCLLSITGEATVQPVFKEGKYFLLLGEIYNYDKRLPSDIYFGIDKYLEHGDEFTKFLDGEFLFIVYNPTTKTIDLFTDPWSTRQAFHYKIDGYFYFSTFPMEEPEGGRFDAAPPVDPIWNNTFFRIPHNSHYRYNVTSGVLTPINTELHKWNLDQYKDNLDDVIESFEEAVLKRYADNATLFLSGGLDSSCVALCLADHKKHFNSITLMLNDSEDTETLNQVLQYTSRYNKNHQITDNNRITNRKHIKSRILLSHANLHYRSQLKMREAAIDIFGSKVTIMANGGDEIVESYMSKGKSEFNVWPNDLTTIFPWHHFYGGQSRRLLDMHETFSLSYGLELRNIFYDKKLAQEWLNVTPEIKNKTPKVFQKLYFDRRGIKKPKKIAGFGTQFKDGEYSKLRPFESR